MNKSQSRYWIFTLNNPAAQLVFDGDVTFAVWQYERGASGTYHFQGYLEFADLKRLRQVVGVIGGGAHVESRRGTQLEAVAYCTKEETRCDGPWTCGRPTDDARGNAPGLASFVRGLSAGSTLSALAREDGCTFVRHSRGLATLAEFWIQPRWRNVTCFYFHGPTGCGKSSLVYDSCGYANVYALAGKVPLWFNGYRGQRVLFIDEYQGEPQQEALLRILDGHPYSAPSKLGFVDAQWNCVVLCSNYDLSGSWAPELWRRFSRGGVFRLRGERGSYFSLAERLKSEVGLGLGVPADGELLGRGGMVGQEGEEVPQEPTGVHAPTGARVPVGVGTYWNGHEFVAPNA